MAGKKRRKKYAWPPKAWLTKARGYHDFTVPGSTLISKPWFKLLPPPVKSVKMKGKTVGRPSKVELALKAALNHQLQKPETQAAIQKMHEDLMIYGTGSISTKDILPPEKRKKSGHAHKIKRLKARRGPRKKRPGSLGQEKKR